MENGIGIEFSFSMDGTENQDLVVGIKIQNLLARTKNLEGLIGTKNCTIGSITKNLLIGIPDLVKNAMTIGQILHLTYSTTNSFAVESVVNVVDGKSMDDNKTHLLTSIGTFAFSLKWYPMKKNVERALVNRCRVSTIARFRNPMKKTTKRHQ